MAILQIGFYGKSIEKRNTLQVVLPEEAHPPFKTLYLLHGLGGDQTDWGRHIDLESAIRKIPLMIVTPNGDRSYYCNNPAPGGARYEDHVAGDIVDFVERTFPVVRDRQARAIAGLSMGGYGALMLALRHPDIFSTAVSHSGSLYFAALPHPSGEGYPSFLMNSLPKDHYNCFALASSAAARGLKPALRFDCGTKDELLDSNRKFHEHLVQIGYAHEYEELRGEHNWVYWKKRFPETLRFVSRQLNLS